MIGAQVSLEQMEKIKSYLDLGKKEGAKVLAGGSAVSYTHLTLPTKLAV